MALTLCSQFLAQGFIHNIHLMVAVKSLPGMAYGKWKNVVWFWLTNAKLHVYLNIKFDNEE